MLKAFDIQSIKLFGGDVNWVALNHHSKVSSYTISILHSPSLFTLYPAGIFAYLNYRVPRTRRDIIQTLIKGLQRLEYRGYDSAGKAATPTSVRVMSVCSAGNRYGSRREQWPRFLDFGSTVGLECQFFH